MTALAYRAIAGLLLGVALMAGWNLFVSHQRGIGYEQCRSETQTKENDELKQARAETLRLFAIHDKALLEGAEREKELVLQREHADASAGRLRDDLANYRRRLPGLSIETCRAYADASLRLLGECQDRYRTVAERAAGHYSDWKTLDQGWPK